MFTYVINTSENRTFESDQLFDLAGYNKISWTNTSLNRLSECAKEIVERQNVLVAEDFCVAIIVDFFGFDRIRAPYGRSGFLGKEEGVDLSLYTPFIEAYINDNVVSYLEKYELFAQKYEVYYVQSEKFERYEFLDNAKEQLEYILSGKENCNSEIRDSVENSLNDKVAEFKENNKKASKEELAEFTEKTRSELEKELTPYSVFSLYCTPTLSLDFIIQDYPYGTPYDSLTFSEFYTAFQERLGVRSKIKSYHYLTTYGGGPVRAAFDTLCLSLYLVYIYEREQDISHLNDLDVAHLDSAALKEVLQTAWSKISLAREIAAENQSTYYSLRQNTGEISRSIKRREEETEEISILNERIRLKKDFKQLKISADTMYREVMKCANKNQDDINNETRQELDALMNAYLIKRDDTNESSIESDFAKLKEMGSLNETKQCPSKMEYDYTIDLKQKEISSLFEKALNAEYIDVEYTEEKENIEEAYKKYWDIRSCMTKNFIGDCVFFVLTLLVFILPYNFLQLGYSDMFVLNAATLEGFTIVLFGGIFLLSFFIHLIIFTARLRAQKQIIKECYLDCMAKKSFSMLALKKRYEQDLIRIEEARYEIRQIKHLYEINIKKDKNVTLHREMLETLHDKLSSMLSNLDIEPIIDPRESIQGEFNLSKSFRSKDNKIYQIFSIETIEKMFRKKGGNDKL